MKFWNLSIFVSAVLLSLISIALPAIQWASIPLDLVSKVMAGTTAAALGVCKLGFFPLAWYQLKRRAFVPGVLLGAFALLFLVINVDATRDLLTAQGQSRTATNQAGNLQHQTLARQLTDLNQTIETVNGLLVADLANGYRERAYKGQKQLELLQQERRNVALALSALSEAAQAAPQARFGVSFGQHTSAGFTGLDGELISALSIQLGCVLAVLASSAWGLPVNPMVVANQKAKPVPGPAHKNETKTKPGAHGLNASQLLLAEQIRAGAFGDQPSVKALIEGKALIGGYKKINPVFQYLVDRGNLRRAGKGYELTQLTIS